MEAIILAGGFGTRLRSVVADLPKAMARVADHPFLYHVIHELKSQGVEHFIFSLGYKHEVIEEFLEKEFPDLSYTIALEEEPLGTGGAISLALNKANAKNVFVVNGDTLFKADLVKLMAFHCMCGADCTLSLKPMQDFDRYGVVELNNDYSIRSFKEKQHYPSGMINGGVYVINREKFVQEDLPEKFSFEKDYLEKYFDKRRMFAVVQDKYFIDIGIPEDFARANSELQEKGKRDKRQGPGL